jgi:uncharacterized protein DUF6931
MGSRIRFTKASQVFEAYPELSGTVTEPSSDVAPEEYATELQQGADPMSALAYFAHVLPKRESVWWGMKCVAGLDQAKNETDREILALSETWVRDGDEESRVAVHSAAEASKGDHAAVWIGLAAGWSGGSLSPNLDHRVEMPDDLTAKAVHTALLIAFGTLEPAKRQDALNSCMSAGLSFAKGSTMPVVSLREQASAAT